MIRRFVYVVLATILAAIPCHGAPPAGPPQGTALKPPAGLTQQQRAEWEAVLKGRPAFRVTSAPARGLRKPQPIQPKPDLTLLDPIAGTARDAEGNWSLYWNVKNLGNAPSPPSKLRIVCTLANTTKAKMVKRLGPQWLLSFEHEICGYLEGSFDIPAIAPGRSPIFPVQTWMAFNARCDNEWWPYAQVSVWADFGNAVAESDEGNNIMHVEICKP